MYEMKACEPNEIDLVKCSSFITAPPIKLLLFAIRGQRLVCIARLPTRLRPATNESQNGVTDVEKSSRPGRRTRNALARAHVRDEIIP